MIQIVITFLYLIATILISLWSKKKARTSKSFEGANLGLLLCVVAGAGEWLGGTSTTGVSEYGYLYGVSGAWYTVANGLGICFLAIFFAKLFRRLNTSTVSGIVGKYLGEDAKKVSAVFLIIIMIAVGTSQMVALGTLGQTLFNLDSVTAILIMGLGVLLYTVLGGMMAVGYTNIMHLIIMYAGAVLAIFLSAKDINGLGTLTTTLPENYFSALNIGPAKVGAWVLASVLGACTAQAGLQPILTSKDEKTAVKSSFLIAAIVAPFGILISILGMIAKVKFPELENAKLALPTLLLSLPKVSGGFIMASIFAAILSTAAPIFLASGTLFSRDVYKSSAKDGEKISDKKMLLVSRTATFVSGLICIGLAIFLGRTSTILDMVYFAYSLRGSMFIILLLGIYWKRTSSRGAIISMILTGIVGIFWVAYKNLYGAYPIHEAFSETYIAVIVATVSTVVFSFIFKKKSNGV